MSEEPLALRSWESMAEAYARLINTKAHNALYERPATLSMLPEVAGKQVLDAGCGPGVYSELLVEKGAVVAAIDVSPKMVQLACKRLGDTVKAIMGNLEGPLLFAYDDSFDLIVSALVLDYLRDLTSVLQEFFRILRSGGRLVFSVGHPLGDFLRHNQGSYYQSKILHETWRGFGDVDVAFVRRPMGELINPVIDAGFVLERLLEPLPYRRVQAR